MTDYAIGDIQGCFDVFQNLLEKIQFSTDCDRLFLLGDLINRGSQSKKTLKFIYKNRDNIKVVLGNHDLHLLACAFDFAKPKPKDTLEGILTHTHRDKWIEWLCHQPLVRHEPERDFLFVHAGIAPQWDTQDAIAYSKEVEKVLQKKPERLLRKLYGNEPSLWQNELTGVKRLRCIVNYCTRMRIINHQGAMDLRFKSSVNNIPDGYIPWFQHPQPNCKSAIAFGHWAALMGNAPNTHQSVYPLDTGCVWGGSLTAMNLDTLETFSVPS